METFYRLVNKYFFKLIFFKYNNPGTVGIMQVGLFHFLEIHIPRKMEVPPPPTPQLTRFEQALVKAQDTYLRKTVFFEFLKEKRIAAHLNVQVHIKFNVG